MTSPLRVLVCVSLLVLVLVAPPSPRHPRPPLLIASSRISSTVELQAAIQAEQARHDEELRQFYATEAAKAAVVPTPKRNEGTEGTHRHRGYATAKECVSMVEHGGSYDQSSNPTHKGRYQFARGTWIGYGGPAAHWDDWSLTSPSEQDAVFETAWNSPGGPSNWLPYDGCG